MPIYIVRVEIFNYYHVKVSADNEDIAKKKAEDGIGVGMDLKKSNTLATVVGEVPPDEEIKKDKK